MFKLSKKKVIIGLILLLLITGAYFLIRFLKSREERPEPEEGPPSVAERLVNKPELSAAGARLKQELVEPLGGAGTVYETDNFRIDWIPSPVDTFEAEIKTTDIVSAESQVVAWFKSKGFSETDICALPVVFYPSWEVKQELEGSGAVFNTSVPEFCQY